jgi:lipid-A-disaccharide synthase
VKHIGMVNIILGESVVPELIQSQVNSQEIFEEVSSILSDEKKYEGLKSKLGSVKQKLGSEGASHKAAQSIMKFVNDF